MIRKANTDFKVVCPLNWFIPAIASAVLEMSACFSVTPNTLSQKKVEKTNFFFSKGFQRTKQKKKHIQMINSILGSQSVS